jgi:ferredoxin-type protein NapH
MKAARLRQRARTAVSLISLLSFPVTLYYLSPAVIAMGAAEGVVTGSAIVFAALFLSSLVLGRGFCSWVCPAGALQDCAARANGRPVKSGRVGLVKYFIWVPWLALIVLLFAKEGGVKAVEPAYMTEQGISALGLPGFLSYYAVIAIFLVIGLLGRRRLACHSICWMAPFMIIGRRIKDALPYPSLRLVARREACTSCGSCDRSCPMSLSVSKLVARGDMRHDECIFCGECVDGCPSKAIAFAFTGAESAKSSAGPSP